MDQFIKHKIKIKYYLRYADDFVILANDRFELEKIISPIKGFLKANLNLEIHPQKIILRRFVWGIDYLGYIVLPRYLLPRTKTKKRAFKKLKSKVYEDNFNQSLQSYLGYFSHANSFKIVNSLIKQL